MLHQEFENWVVTNNNFFKEHEIKVEITHGAKTDNPAISADFDTKSFIGRIIVWSSGHCDMEILSLETGKRVMPYTYVLISSPTEFDLVFKDFFSALIKSDD